MNKKPPVTPVVSAIAIAAGLYAGFYTWSVERKLSSGPITVNPTAP